MIYVNHLDHTSFVVPNGGVLNLEDQGYFGLPEYTEDELYILIGKGKAQFLGENGQTKTGSGNGFLR